MIIYVFGGSFNPPHKGHLEIVERLIPNCDRLYIMPLNYLPQYGKSKMFTSSVHRFEMCKIAFEEISSKIEVSNYELSLDKPSYSIYTARWIMKNIPNCNLSLVVGEDQLQNLNSWYKFEELKDMVNFICFSRNHFKKINNLDYKYVNDFESNISSTDIRTSFKNNLDHAKSMISNDVYKYIIEKGLYGI